MNGSVALIAALFAGGGLTGIISILSVRSSNRANNASAAGSVSAAWEKLFEPYRKRIADLVAGQDLLRTKVEALAATNRAQVEDLAAQTAALHVQAQTISGQADRLTEQAGNIERQATAMNQQVSGITKQALRINVLEIALRAGGIDVPDTYSEVRSDGSSAPQPDGATDPYGGSQTAEQLARHPPDPAPKEKP